jgi:DNA invertase Pin-like site-specific DNA recombinase
MEHRSPGVGGFPKVLVAVFHALAEAGIATERIYVDKKSGSTTDRPGLRALLGYACNGDVIVVHTLDRLGRTVRDTLNLIHDLSARGVGVRNLADPNRIDSSNADDPMAQLAVVLLALFGQMERTYSLERAAHARAVATSKGRRTGRPVIVDPHKLAWAEPFTRGRAHRGRDRGQDRDSPDQPLSAPAAASAGTGDRSWRAC